MFRTVPPLIIRSFSLYTQQWYMSVRNSDPSWSCWSQADSKICMTCTIDVFTVKTPDDGQRNCPKHVEFYSKNKFEKLVHLIGFITKTNHAASHHSSSSSGVFQSTWIWKIGLQFPAVPVDLYAEIHSEHTGRICNTSDLYSGCVKFESWLGYLIELNCAWIALISVGELALWRRIFFNLAHSVYKMWIIQEQNTLELWNKLHFEEEKTESIYHV